MAERSIYKTIKSKLFLFVPLFLVESYLLFTIYLLFFGPIIWPLENQTKLLTLLVLYHLAFIAGYAISMTWLFKFRLPFSKEGFQSRDVENFAIKNFGLFIFISFICSMISHRNITHSDSYLPLSFFSDFLASLKDPPTARAYYASNQYALNFSGNSYVTGFLLLFGVLKYSLLPATLYLWPRLSTAKKIVSVLVLFIPIMTGITISISAISFSYMFIIFACFTFFLFDYSNPGFKRMVLERKFFVSAFFCLFFFSFWHFYTVKSGVTPYQAVILNEKPTTFKYLTTKNKVVFRNDDKNSLSTDFGQKLTSYLVQGYVGMSFSIGEEFQSSFGIGHSLFLQRNFAKHLGLDVSARTFQHKITDRWDENVNWHTAYTHFANDVGFYGVIAVMFILGLSLARTIYLLSIENNFYAKLLIPLYCIMFLYFPANNQVFGYLEYMSPFWVLTVLLIFSSIKTKQKV